MPDRKDTKALRKLVGRKNLIARAALDRGLRVEPIDGDIFLVEGNGRQEFFQHTMAGSIGHIAETVSWSKRLTKIFFARNGVPTPQGISFPARAVDKAVAFMAGSGASRFVLKPDGGELGAHVFMGIDSEQALRDKVAAIPRRFRTLLLEEEAPGTECRYFAVGNRVVAVAERRPANVVGDGRLSVGDLIARKNAARAGHLTLVPIVADAETRDLLAWQGMDLGTVPVAGQAVRLKRVSNISQGGDSLDITDEVHDDLKALAVAALRSVPTLLYAGIDVIAEDHRAPLAGQRAVVLELNWYPMISMHHAPAEGLPRDVAGAIIDHLFFGPS